MSDETKWTRGPWELDLREHEQPYQKIRVRSAEYQYRIIAELWMDDSPLLDYNEEQKANAYLFAAAPELAEVARKLVEDYEAWQRDDMSPHEIGDIVDEARDAYAKARGETS